MVLVRVVPSTALMGYRMRDVNSSGDWGSLKSKTDLKMVPVRVGPSTALMRNRAHDVTRNVRNLVTVLVCTFPDCDQGFNCYRYR